MKKIIYSLIVALLISILPESDAVATTTSLPKTSEIEVQLLKEKGKKRKLKKTLRKTGRVYRSITKETKNKKQSRKIQRGIRKVINIF